jgi:hypothetical protein
MMKWIFAAIAFGILTVSFDGISGAGHDRVCRQ